MESVLFCCFGSTGDVRPAVALALGMAATKRVALMAPPDLLPAGPDPRVTWIPYGGEFRDFATRPDIASYRRAISAQFESLDGMTFKPDSVMAFGLFYAAEAWAERRDLAYRYLALTPQAFPSRRLSPPTGPVTSNRALIRLKRFRATVEENAIVGPVVNRERGRFGLKPLKDMHETRTRGGPILAVDEPLAPLPVDFPNVGRIPYPAFPPGADPWSNPHSEDDEALEDLFARGPVAYLGLGSMGSFFPSALDALDAFSLKLAENGIGCVIGGYGKPGSSPHKLILRRGYLDHARILPRCAIAVHHGGIGTTMTACLSGTPQFIVPFILDQFYWARRVEELGVGIRGNGAKDLGADSTIALISKALSEGALANRAREFARELTSFPERRALIEKGLVGGAHLSHRDGANTVSEYAGPSMRRFVKRPPPESSRPLLTFYRTTIF